MMFPLGHLGITLFLASLFSLSFIHVAIASLLPDLIDKPLKLMGIATCGRYIGHTLFAGLVISCVIYLITRKKILFISVLFGYWVHLLEDISLIPWFYPFIEYKFPVCPPVPRYGLFGLITDSIGLVLLIYLFHTNSRFRESLSQIVNTLKIRVHGRKPPEQINFYPSNR